MLPQLWLDRPSLSRANQDPDCRKDSHAAIENVSKAGKELASSSGSRCVLQNAKKHMLEKALGLEKGTVGRHMLHLRSCKKRVS